MIERPNDLDLPWAEVLDVPARASSCLTRLGLVTLREAIEAARGTELLEQPNFGRVSLLRLRLAVKSWETRGARRAARGVGPGPEPAGPELDLFDTPWSEVLAGLPRSVEAGLRRANAVTLREAFEIATGQPRRRWKGLSAATRRRLLAAIRQYVEPDAESSGPEPETVASPPAGQAQDRAQLLRELVRDAVAAVPVSRRGIFVARYIDRVKLDDIAHPLGVTRERARQIASQQLNRARARMSRRATEAMRPVIERLDANGIVHVTDLRDLCGDADAVTVALCLRLAMIDDVRVYRDEFVVRAPHQDLERALIAIRAALRWRNKWRATPDEVAAKICADTGWRVSLPCVARLMAPAGGSAQPADGSEPCDPPLPAPSLAQHRMARLAAIVKEAGRPLRASEIVSRFLETNPCWEAHDASLRRGVSPEVPSRTHVDALVRSYLARQREIYRIGPATYAHLDCLPVEPELLSWAVEWCVGRLRGRATALSTSVLIAELARRRPEASAISAELLKSALAKHPEVVGLRKRLVGHAPSLEDRELLIEDRVEAVLRSASKPLTQRAVYDELVRQGTEFWKHCVTSALKDNPRILGLRDGTFVHVERIGLAPGERAALIEAALRLLPDDGADASITEILGTLDTAPAFGDLVAPRRVEMVVHALLLKDGRFE